ncbi:LysR family transcriptional regulator [Actinomadura sp. KC345]|uniref:LysR family transcriptional regulator n=1 Tax=Actinomadura sp. KC345 TaxID=2530371 RepID=UPI001404D5D5|nr:LysR family transcriptional regulator [Actinomadura sp. KC345]
MGVELADVETFLAVAEELHFGHAAERLQVSPARVTQRIQALERQVGGALFERTSRKVVLTPLGSRLRDGLRSAHAQFTSAMDTARTSARAVAGPLRIGFTATTGGEELNALVRAAERAHPDIEVHLHEVPMTTPFDALHRDEVDVLVNWLFPHSPEITLGPPLAEHAMVLLVAAGHPLADRTAVCLEDLADYVLNDMPSLRRPSGDPWFHPRRTPSGRALRLWPVTGLGDALSQVAWGKTVHATVTSMRRLVGRSDVVFVPIDDLPPVKLGLLWRTAHENARIRALAALAATRRTSDPPSAGS